MTKRDAKRFVCQAVAEMMREQHLNDVLADEVDECDVDRVEDAYEELASELEKRGKSA